MGWVLWLKMVDRVMRLGLGVAAYSILYSWRKGIGRNSMGEGLLDLSSYKSLQVDIKTRSLTSSSSTLSFCSLSLQYPKCNDNRLDRQLRSFKSMWQRSKSSEDQRIKREKKSKRRTKRPITSSSNRPREHTNPFISFHFSSSHASSSSTSSLMIPLKKIW